MWPQTSNGVLGNVCGKLGACHAKPKHTNHFVTVPYPGMNVPTTECPCDMAVSPFVMHILYQQHLRYKKKSWISFLLEHVYHEMTYLLKLYSHRQWQFYFCAYFIFLLHSLSDLSVSVKKVTPLWNSKILFWDTKTITYGAHEMSLPTFSVG
jgi:hypothetical protein